MKAALLVSELGLLLVGEEYEVLASKAFDPKDRVGAYLNVEAGTLEDGLEDILRKAKEEGIRVIASQEPLLEVIRRQGFQAVKLEREELAALIERKLQLLVKAGLAKDEREAEGALREFALELGRRKIRELSSRFDLRTIQAIESIDELDRVINSLHLRLKEWYGLHFPELASLVDDAFTYARLIAQLGARDSFKPERLKQLGLAPDRCGKIVEAAKASKGGLMAPAELAHLASLAEEVLHLAGIRDELLKEVEAMMRSLAPNLSSVVGPAIGARLMAKAGGLERLARLPASTIQVLGAEKALFRALRMGSRPPKHGIIFQHRAVHSAPRWMRGKIARSLASRIALAARIDAFRGGIEEGLNERLEERLKEIRAKYPVPPKGRRGRKGKRR